MLLAIHRAAIEGHALTANVLNLRFISSQGLQSVITVASWPAERQAELNKTVTLSLDDTPVAEALSVISRLSGVTITLDDSRERCLRMCLSPLKPRTCAWKACCSHWSRQTDLPCHTHGHRHHLGVEEIVAGISGSDVGDDGSGRA